MDMEEYGELGALRRMYDKYMRKRKMVTAFMTGCHTVKVGLLSPITDPPHPRLREQTDNVHNDGWPTVTHH